MSAEHPFEGLELVRFAWCDPHGLLRTKALTVPAALVAMRQGLGMVSTLALKDSADKTAFRVFEPGIAAHLSEFAGAGNLLMKAMAGSLKVLPWAQATGWLQCEAYFSSGQAMPLDTRAMLRRALARLAERGLGLVCGLEVEFHIYRLRSGSDRSLDPEQAEWPGPAPLVDMVHPGYHLLSEHALDQCEEPLRIVQRTAQALGLPLSSLEIELGPSQIEAVFEPTDALRAADNMVLFRSAVRQALRRAGYHATFMCRPPFPQIMSSGWHLHQSLVHLSDGRNAFMRDSAQPEADPSAARSVLSDLGAHYLAGLLAHAPAMTALCTPTINGYARFRPNAMAPQTVGWGRDHRGAMLRVIASVGDPASRIENRLGEPAANPYLYIASQIHAGLHGIDARLRPPPSEDLRGQPQDSPAQALPAQLRQALHALGQDSALLEGLSPAFIAYYCGIKQQELARFEAAADQLEFERREYFARI